MTDFKIRTLLFFFAFTAVGGINVKPQILSVETKTYVFQSILGEIANHVRGEMGFILKQNFELSHVGFQKADSPE